MLQDEQPSPEQIKIWQSMSGVEKLRLAEELWWSARDFKAAAIKTQHPDWTEEQVETEVRRIFINAQT